MIINCESFLWANSKTRAGSSPASLIFSFLPPSPLLFSSLVREMQLVRLTGSAAQESKSTTKAIDSITVGIAKSKKAVLLLGAGVSTRAGIPVSLLHLIKLYAYSQPFKHAYRTFVRRILDSIHLHHLPLLLPLPLAQVHLQMAHQHLQALPQLP